MRFYTNQHQHYCGIDLHTRSMYTCIVDQEGEILLHKDLPADPEVFLKTIDPFREDLVVAVECIFTWYWLADLCALEKIPFVLGHALYMKAIHGAKVKSDKIDSRKIAQLLRSGLIPQAYVYPRQMRATRDLLRRRCYLVRQRSSLLAHVQNSASQWNLPAFGKRPDRSFNHEWITAQFEDRCVQESVKADLKLIDHLNHLIADLERFILDTALVHDPNALRLLQTIPGIGKTLSLLMLYEIHDMNRFDRVQEFASYSRLVKCYKESAGKRYGSSGKKMGNRHLKWAFSEAAVMFLRRNPTGQAYKRRLAQKYGKGRALSILAHKLDRAVYHMLKRNQAFEIKRFMNA